MTLFTLALCVAFVSTQLALLQHTALMELYDAVGATRRIFFGKNVFLFSTLMFFS